MEITIDDYEVINRYSGSDRSWHDRVSANNGKEKLLASSRREVRKFLIFAGFDARTLQ